MKSPTWLDPRIWGMGIGGRLVKECVPFARESRYNRNTFWPKASCKAPAASINQNTFTLTRQFLHRDFGFDLTGETWQSTC